MWESEEEKRVRNCLGVDGKPTRETQDYGLWQSDSLRSENMNLKFGDVAQLLGCGH